MGGFELNFKLTRQFFTSFPLISDSPVVSKLVPAGIPLVDYHILFTSSPKGTKEQEALIDYKFNSHDLVCLAFSTVVGLWYIFKKVIL